MTSRFPFLRRRNNRFFCHYPFSSIFVTLDGKVRPCCFGPPAGDLNETSLAEIWNGAAMQARRNGLIEGDMVSAGCAECGWKNRRDLATYPFNWKMGQHRLIQRNMKRQRREYKKGKIILKSLPSQAIIQLTYGCNHSCQMCIQQRTNEHLSEEILGKCLSISDFLDNIQFTGGEPFVSRWLQSYLRVFDFSRNQMIGFSTNGSLIHLYRDILLMAPRLLLGISAHAGRQETYEKITRSGDWKTFIDNATWYAEERKKRRPFWNSGRFAFVVMKNNYTEIPEFLQLAQRLEMPVMFSPVWGENARPQNIFDNPDLREGLPEVAEIWKQSRVIIDRMPEFEKQETHTSLRYTLSLLSPLGEHMGISRK